ncbi:unnamed protein product [Rangifer tarandus platyrhynchus]|uniref:Uncharacterized protein n=1 Tax=Rangifer tarandus platyrhynchus TaxID=3082113 RepID=A0ABN8YIE2_RANTA|nr:unnamed protein product [Rangifer tarandus platyrhynchus]
MSPHGKRAGSQAQGQPRPPRSTLRAPDPLGCAPRVPGSLGAALPGQSACRRTPTCAPPQGAPVPPPPVPAHTWADQAQKEAGRGALRFLPPLPPLEQRRPVPSPWAAALHNRGSGACPAAARGVTLHLARTWAAALLTARPSAPAGGRDPRAHRGSPGVGVGHLLLPGTSAAQCVVSTPAGGKRETWKNCPSR